MGEKNLNISEISVLKNLVFVQEEKNLFAHMSVKPLGGGRGVNTLENMHMTLGVMSLFMDALTYHHVHLFIYS